tara:strand:- start:452 stop:898 length:447 start_codon:yes stop_codon:yes gene_type:complete
MVATTEKTVQMCVIPAGDVITGWTHAKRITISSCPTLDTLQEAVGGLIEVVPAKWIDLSMHMSAFVKQLGYTAGMGMDEFMKISTSHFAERNTTEMIVNEEGLLHDLPVNHLATYINRGYYLAEGQPMIAAGVELHGAAVLFSDFILE